MSNGQVLKNNIWTSGDEYLLSVSQNTFECCRKILDFLSKLIIISNLLWILNSQFFLIWYSHAGIRTYQHLVASIVTELPHCDTL